MWLLPILFDPLGIETASDNASRQIFQRIYAPFYPDRGQDQIKVILVQDDDLPLSQEGNSFWPPRFDEYAAILDTLAGDAAQKPEAVFVDLILDRMPASDESVDALCAAIRQAEQNDVPIFFARLPDFENDAAPLPRTLALCDFELRTAMAGWTGEAHLYPLRVEAGGETFKTAAAALFEHGMDRAARPETLDRYTVSREKGHAINLVWGGRPPVQRDQCTTYPESAREQAVRSLRIFWDGILPVKNTRARFERQQSCLYHARLPAQLFVRGADVDKFLLRRDVAGKYVFIGAQVRGIPDLAFSPVHGQVPGVFMHAMALDNLLTFESGYIRPSPNLLFLPDGITDITADIVWQFVLILVLIGMIVLVASGNPRRPSFGLRILNTGKRAGLFVAFIAAILISLSLSFFVLRWAPMNWGGTLSLAAAIILTRRLSNIDTSEKETL